MSCDTDSDTEIFHFQAPGPAPVVLVCQHKFLQLGQLYLLFIAGGHLAQTECQQVMSCQGHER